MSVNITGPEIYFELFGIPIDETIVNMWLVMGFILIVCFIISRKPTKVPGKLQVIAEAIVSGINGLTESTMGGDKMYFASYMLSLFMFLGIANLTGLVGLRQPTADLTVTLTLALITFFMTQFFAIKANKIGGYLKGFLQPMPFLLPINIIGEIANPISLSFRLFGNMLGGLIIMELLYAALMAVTPFIALVIPLPFNFYFDVFAGLLQSFIFVMLSMVFIAMAMDD
jgi:F-type H+-transporting ATPase subunit a